jgi:hypothetical protein
MTKHKTLETTVKADPKVCFSYIRFSTKQQGGDDKSSEWRQSEIAPRVAKEKGWLLDETLNIADLGVSAFKGKNATTGNLGILLDALKEGRIPKGRICIIEAWDRLTRMEVDEAYELFRNLLKNGLEIYVDRGSRHLTKASLNNIVDLITTILELNASNEYSAKLSERCKKGLAKLRTGFIENGKPYRFKTFGWLRWNDDKKEHEVIPEKVAFIKRLFEVANTGRGVRTIAKTLNDEGIPYIGANGSNKHPQWSCTCVRRILRGKEVLGFNCNVEPPIKMFPAIISEKEYYAANARMDLRKTHKFYGRTGDAKNLFSHIAKCAKCGKALAMRHCVSGGTQQKLKPNFGARGGVGSRGGKGINTYLYCSGFNHGSCSGKGFVYEQFETSFSQSLFRPDFAETFNRDVSPNSDKAKILQGQLVEVEKKLERVTADYNLHPESPGITSALVKTEEQKKELLAKLEGEKTLTIGTTPINAAYREFLASVHHDWNNRETRLKLRELIRSMVESISMDIPTRSYEIHWKNGSPTTKVECFKNACRIDGKEYVFTSSLDNGKPKPVKAAA